MKRHDPVVGIFASNLAIAVLSVGAQILISRALGPEGRGLYAAVLIVPTLMVAVFDAGIRQSFQVEYANAIDQRTQLVPTLAWLTLVIGILGGMVSWGVIQLQFADTPSTYLLMAAAGTVIGRLLLSARSGIYIAAGQYSDFNRVRTLAAAIFAVLIGVLYLSDALTATRAILLLAAASGLVGFWGLLLPLGQPPSTSDASSILSRGARLSTNSLLLLLNYRLDEFLLQRLASLNQLGIYTVGVGVAELLWQLATAVATKRFADSARIGDSQTAWVVLRQARRTAMLTTLGGVGAGILAPLLIPPVFGVEFAPASAVVWALVPGVISFSMFRVINAHMTASGLERAAGQLIAVAVGVNAVLNILLIPRYGSVGAAIASSCSYTVAAVAGARKVAPAGYGPAQIFLPRVADLRRLN